MGILLCRKLFKTEGFERVQTNILMESSDARVVHWQNASLIKKR